ncbi:unnamed protein product [Sphagnum balticum]
MFITVGQRTDDVILANGSYFTIAYASDGWRNLSLPSGVSANNWSLSTVIDLRVRPDGTWNTPPIATMISPVYIPVGVQQTILIPTIDADNDNIRCRFASGSNECGTVCPPASLRLVEDFETQRVQHLTAQCPFSSSSMYTFNRPVRNGRTCMETFLPVHVSA